MKKLLLFYAAGCLGGLVNSIALWLLGNFDITRTLGIDIAPALTSAWLYPRIVWGGIWGLTFVLPMLDAKLLLKGSLLSLFPTLVQLFVIYPYQTHKGMAGLELGMLTPLLVLTLNWVWGLTTALSIKLAK
ncbi:MAG TPA: hypothetical protein ENN06_05710 [Desulfobacteraceae bacterium]|nr:hypothetical protein [Desulfobacteraceae bacterium]